MRIKITILLLLCIAVFQSSYAQNENEDEPAPLRKTGCSNPKFIAAEQQAFQELLDERARIDKWREDTITRIEWVKRDELDRANRRYLAQLNGCKDAECNTGAKVKYDDDVTIALAFRDKCLKIVRRMAAEKYEDAQEVYNKAVDAAIRLYCHSYTASGKDGPIVYSGTICSLEKTFTVTGTHPMLVYPLKFVPSSDTTGTFSYSIQMGQGSMSGHGTYTVEGLDTGHPRIIVQEESNARVANVGSAGSGMAHIDLTPLGTNACEGK